MGLFDKLFKKEPVQFVAAEKNVLYAPITGTYIPLQEIGDPKLSRT